jgi:hypothetical protein
LRLPRSAHGAAASRRLPDSRRSKPAARRNRCALPPVAPAGSRMIARAARPQPAILPIGISAHRDDSPGAVLARQQVRAVRQSLYVAKLPPCLSVVRRPASFHGPSERRLQAAIDRPAWHKKCQVRVDGLGGRAAYRIRTGDLRITSKIRPVQPRPCGAISPAHPGPRAIAVHDHPGSWLAKC